MRGCLAIPSPYQAKNRSKRRKYQLQKDDHTRHGLNRRGQQQLFKSLVVSTTSSAGLENVSLLLVVIDKASTKLFYGPMNKTAERFSLEKTVRKNH